ncbi:serine protease [Physocladia obscura]|uniref:Serine protease n=1 Tax=Physocladia obscura TaxID=109957 RepID=A0AAD5T3R9_9FUNG|nr:serine protease [Physocladia obscura]
MNSAYDSGIVNCQVRKSERFIEKIVAVKMDIDEDHLSSVTGNNSTNNNNNGGGAGAINGSNNDVPLAVVGAAVHSAKQWEQTLTRIIPAIVSIKMIVVRAFGALLKKDYLDSLTNRNPQTYINEKNCEIDTDTQKSSQASGFVVDKTRGLILTNRHVVHPGPILAEAIFNQSKEEIKLVPVYRDPVHDFGFFRFNTSDVKYMDLIEIPLVTDVDKVRVGVDVRVVGNDSGERLSILSGTLARLDRKAPFYGAGKYNDWNTFYYQAASMTSGGSSGSPVVNVDGEAIALNAGGSTSAASSFFLPLDRIVRVLQYLQNGVLTIPRGTLQTVFKYSPYDEVKRQGLRAEIEDEVRKGFPDGTGMLVVNQVVPRGPGDGVIETGDIVIRVNNTLLTTFVPLETIFDSSVGQTVTFTVQRGVEIKDFQVVVQDLHVITPDRYVEIGGGILNTVSYQMAKSYMVPAEGVFVAGAGYMLGMAGLSRKCCIIELNNVRVLTLDKFIEVMETLRDRERVPLRFYHLSDINKERVSLVQIDRRWHGFNMAIRDASSGLWNYTAMKPCIGPAIYEPHTASHLELEQNLGPGRDVIPSLIHIECHMPFFIDGVAHSVSSGIGVVVDAELGLVVCDRHTIPITLGDVLLTFCNSIIIPGKIIFIHQVYNFVLLSYDVTLLGDTFVKSAVFSEKELVQGDTAYQALSDIYTSGIELENPLGTAGVLTDDSGHVQALFAPHTKYSTKGRSEFFMGIPVSLLTPIISAVRTHMVLNGVATPLPHDIIGYTLEAELSYAQVAHARVLGLPDAWVRKIEGTHLSRRNVLIVRRVTSGTEAANLLKEGDMILAVDDSPTTNYVDIMKHSEKKELNLTVMREKKEVHLTVPSSLMEIQTSERIVGWSGAVFQMPHKSIFQQLKVVPSGVLCSVVYEGSPAQMYQLNPLSWVTEINGEKIVDLDDFVRAVSKIPSETFARLKTVNFNRFVKVIAIRTNSHYFGTWQLKKDVGEWVLETITILPSNSLEASKHVKCPNLSKSQQTENAIAITNIRSIKLTLLEIADK